jgi:dTDP-glucose pyrophosphorylase
MTGVVLAAGKGSRIAQLPTMLPKAVLPVLGEPIIFRQLRTMVSLGIKKCYVVVGHLGYAVVREIERLPNPGIEIEYIEQEQALGIAHSVGRLEPHINGPFMLFLGDIYLRAPKIAEMLRVFSQGNIHGVLGGIKESRTEIIRRNFCIVADESGRVTQVLEKPSQPISDLKGVGVYVFDTNIFDAIKRTPRTAMRNEYEITHSIQILIWSTCSCCMNGVNKIFSAMEALWVAARSCSIPLWEWVRASAKTVCCTTAWFLAV